MQMQSSVSVLILIPVLLCFLAGVATAPHSSQETYSSEEMVVPRHPKISGDKVEHIQLSADEKPKSLECEIQGTPTPKAVWLKNSKELPKQFETSYSSKGGIGTLKLKFDDIEENQLAGNYTCVAVNFLGQTSRSFIITINLLPYFIKNDDILTLSTTTEKNSNMI